MQLGPIKAASYSRVVVYEQCPKRAHLAFVQKIPEPARKTENPLDRGSRIHDLGEQYVRGSITDCPKELLPFQDEFNVLRTTFVDSPDDLELEQLWCFNQSWESVAEDDWTNIWVRIKLDALRFKGNTAIAIDYKTGKRFGNEVKHAQQMQLYQLGTFLKYPQIETVITELWYLDQDHVETATFTRQQGLLFLKGFNERFTAMTTATVFPPKPSIHTCRFCPYKTGMITKKGPKGTGDCDLNPV